MVLSLTPELAALNYALGLPPLLREICHGYSNACVCEGCMKRERRRDDAGLPIRQPWELEEAA